MHWLLGGKQGCWLQEEFREKEKKCKDFVIGVCNANPLNIYKFLRRYPCLVNVVWNWVCSGEGLEFLCLAFSEVCNQGALRHSCLKYQSLSVFLQGEIDLWRERFIRPSWNGEVSLGLVTQYENRVWRRSPAHHTIHMCVGGRFVFRRGLLTHQRELLPGVLGKAAILPRATGRRQCESPCSLPSSLLYWLRKQVCRIRN